MRSHTESNLKIGDVVEAMNNVPRNRYKNEYEEPPLLMTHLEWCNRFEDEKEEVAIIQKETQLLIVDLSVISGVEIIYFFDFPKEKYLPKDFRKVPEKSWMERNYSRKVFVMPVQYVVDHLDDFAKEHMDLSKYDQKEEGLTKKINLRFETIQDWPPLKLTLNPDKEVFGVEDGITRLRYSLRNKVSHLKIMLY